MLKLHREILFSSNMLKVYKSKFLQCQLRFAELHADKGGGYDCRNRGGSKEMY
mgnify:CR=1 FL=1